MFVLTSAPTPAVYFGDNLHTRYYSQPTSDYGRYYAALAEARRAELEYAAAIARQEERIRRHREEAWLRSRRQGTYRRQLILDDIRGPNVTYVVDSPVHYNDVYPVPSRRTFPFADRAAFRRQRAADALNLQSMLLGRLRQEDHRILGDRLDRGLCRSPAVAQHAAEDHRQRRRAQATSDQGLEQLFRLLFAASSSHRSADAENEQSRATRGTLPDLSSDDQKRFRDELEANLASFVKSLYDNSSLGAHNAPKTETGAVSSSSVDAKGKGKGKNILFDVPPTVATSKDVVLAMETIHSIDTSFDILTHDFEFPRNLDFESPPSTASGDGSLSEPKLAYTSRNAPVRYYEQALNALMTQLDGVGSFGNEEVRAQRKIVVEKVEKALNEVEKEVEERLRYFKWSENQRIVRASAEAQTETGRTANQASTTEPIRIAISGPQEQAANTASPLSDSQNIFIEKLPLSHPSAAVSDGATPILIPITSSEADKQSINASVNTDVDGGVHRADVDGVHEESGVHVAESSLPDADEAVREVDVIDQPQGFISEAPAPCESHEVTSQPQIPNDEAAHSEKQETLHASSLSQETPPDSPVTVAVNIADHLAENSDPVAGILASDSAVPVESQPDPDAGDDFLLNLNAEQQALTPSSTKSEREVVVLDDSDHDAEWTEVDDV